MSTLPLTLPLLLAVSPATYDGYGYELIVNVSEIRPCAIYNGEQISGFEVELFKLCAAELGLPFRLHRVPFADKLEQVRQGQAHVAIAGISITAARERDLDFSLPTLNSGLRILVRDEGSRLPGLSPGTIRILGGLLLFVVALGHVLWLCERGGKAVNARYFPGIFEAFWCVAATMTTVGYGDVVPEEWSGRLLAAVIMLVGIGLFGLIVAAFTADIMQDRQASDIASYHDLAGLNIATKAGTTSSDFLREQGFSVRDAATFADACELLRSGEADAVVYDDPSVRYLARHDSDFVAAAEVFQPQYYGFAFAQGDPLVEQFNQALLRVKESGQYDRLYQRWFGNE